MVFVYCFDILNLAPHAEYIPPPEAQQILANQEVPLVSRDWGAPMGRVGARVVGKPWERAYRAHFDDVMV